jgi:hypothetical protein
MPANALPLLFDADEYNEHNRVAELPAGIELQERIHDGRPDDGQVK